MTERIEKLRGLYKDLAAIYLNQESNRSSLITVTDVQVSKERKRAIVFATVYPEEQEQAVLDFLKRKRSDFKKYVASHAKMRRVPFFDFAIDKGEKHRQNLDQLAEQ
jgi:ribosome-binding factor A